MRPERAIKNTGSILVFALVFVSQSTVGVPGTKNLGVKVARAAGAWEFCNQDTTSFCIEKVTITTPSDESKDYLSSDAMAEDGVLVDASCLSPTGLCLGGPTSAEIAKANSEGCSTIATQIPFPVYINAAVAGHRDYEVTITLNLGTNEPGYTIGSGIQGTTVRQDSNGWHYTIRTKSVVKTYATLSDELKNWGNAPGYMEAYNEFMSTASADSATASSTVTIWPPQMLRWTVNPYTTAGGHKLTWITSKMCDYIPLGGAWFSANAGAFEFGIETNQTQSDVPWFFNFAASAPHFIDASLLDAQPMESFGTYDQRPLSGSIIVNPAEIKMWVPKAYGIKLGYSSAAQFQSGIHVATEDNQLASPTVTDVDNGYLINLGISHYSAPNPEVRFTPGPGYVRPFSISSTPATTSLSKPKVRISRLTSGKSIASYLKIQVPTKSTIGLKVARSSARICKVRGTSIQGTKVGSCRFTITVKPPRGATKSRTISLKVTR